MWTTPQIQPDFPAREQVLELNPKVRPRVCLCFDKTDWDSPNSGGCRLFRVSRGHPEAFLGQQRYIIIYSVQWVTAAPRGTTGGAGGGGWPCDSQLTLCLPNTTSWILNTTMMLCEPAGGTNTNHNLLSSTYLDVHTLQFLSREITQSQTCSFMSAERGGAYREARLTFDDFCTWSPM